MENFFESNIDLWARKEPKEALLMHYLEEGDVSYCLTDLGEDNLCRKIVGRQEYFHSQKGAVAEAKNWYSNLNLVDTDVLYVFGVGFGYYYDAIEPWLRAEPGHTVVFLEDDLHVIAEFFKTERAHRLLEDSQAHLVYLKEGSSLKDLLGEQYWNYAMTKAKVSALKYYEEIKEKMLSEIAHEISYSSDLKKALLDEYLSFGGPFFVNYYRNMLHLSKSYFGDKLFGKFANVPAIICGAGPSLEKNGPLLKQLSQRALIFAGGSSINILNNLGIQPHFCAGIDPNDAQQVRLRNNQAFEVPYFYRQRLNYGAFQTVHGPRLYVTGSGGYDVAEFFEERLGIQGNFFEEGHNVINFASEIAYQMGCNPIIFVGMDLAFTDRKTYSAGVTFDPKVEQRTLDEYANFETVGMLRKDVFGNPIYTLWKWVAEAEWIGSWAENHSECRLINCTEGGIGFPGIPNQTLVETAKELLKETYDLQGWIHSEVQNSSIPEVTQERVEKTMLELRDSLSRCCEDFKILIDDTERLIQKMSLEQKVFANAQSGKAALVEYDLGEEPAYKAIIEIFNTVASRLLNKDLVYIRQNTNNQEDWQKAILRLELNKKKLGFLYDAAKVNVGIIDFAFEEKDKELAAQKILNLENMELPKLSNEAQKQIFPKSSDSQKQGPLCSFYDSGGVKSKTHFQEGLLHGLSQYFSESGALLSKANFKAGKLDGELLQYYPSGAKYSEQFFKEGLPEGKQRYYYKNGQLKTELNYEQGQIVGPATLYEADGSIKRQIQIDLVNK